jgi:SagB-type dehydrogenase family enzyme
MEHKIWKEFMESTKYKNMGKPDQEKGLPHPSLEQEIDPSKPTIELTNPTKIKVNKIDIRKAIEERKSFRKYENKPLTLSEISWLLWCTQGVKKITKRPATLRTVPSAGARHPFETYLLVNNVEGFEPGLYKFLASKHLIQVIELDENIIDKFADANWSSEMVKDSAITFIWVAVLYRMTYRYGNRGIRYLHLDAGHICQNLYLASEAIDCGVCAVGGFIDDTVNALLGLDGEEQFVTYMATVGKKHPLP